MTGRVVALTSDAIEASLFAWLDDAEPLADIRIVRPGERNDGRSERWLEPRLVRFARDASTSRNGAESHTVVLSFTCWVKSSHKGGRFGVLSAFVDLVRMVVDGTASAPGFRVRDPDSGTILATMAWGAANEVRRYGVAANIDGVSHPNHDQAILTVEAVLSAA